jgi:hypothetical protein
MPARGCPQPSDQRQDFLEHLSRQRDLGHIWKETNRPWLTTIAPILVSFSHSSSATTAAPPWALPASHEIAEVVGEGMELEANSRSRRRCGTTDGPT